LAWLFDLIERLGNKLPGAERSGLRQRFAAEAAESEREALGSGKAHSLAATFDYLAERVAGKNPRRPRARSWRASK
jgi:hypothetical protein